MNNNETWPEDRADWPHAVGAVQGGVVPNGYVLDGIDCKHGCHKNAFSDKRTCGIDAVIAGPQQQAK